MVRILFVLPFFLTVSCQTLKKKKDENNDTSKIELKSEVLIGFNQNFSMMPNLNAQMCERIQQLKPQMLRYPGGTVTHGWNWREGVIETRKSKSTHPISDIKTLTEYTNAGFVFVLDILNKTLSDQIEMLTSIEKLGIEISYIELGNELYAQDENYISVFPSGKDYAQKVLEWLPELRRNFPKAKIAALLLGRKVRESNVRMYNWNNLVVGYTMNKIDAFTYHIYLNENKTFEQESREFVEVAQNAMTEEKELWITEYGSNQDKSQPGYYTELASLADFVEHFPNVTVALNHQIVGGTKSKLTDDGSDFVEEGIMFLKRVQN